MNTNIERYYSVTTSTGASINKELDVRTSSATVLFFDWLVSILNVFAI